MLRVSNSLSPKIRYPINLIRGTVYQRQQKSADYVDKLYKDLYSKYKAGKLPFEEVQKSVDKIIGKDKNIHVLRTDVNDEFGGQDVIISDYMNKVSSITLLLDIGKRKFLNYTDLITIVHEFQHVVDLFFNPKYLSRYQHMFSKGMYNPKYDKIYSDFFYVQNRPAARKNKAKVIKNIEYKFHKFLRRMSAADKLNYIQDTRYYLISEDQAYRTQYKYAKKLCKKHIPMLAEDIEYQNNKFMFQEKIRLLNRMGLEVIQKERSKYARVQKQKI